MTEAGVPVTPLEERIRSLPAVSDWPEMASLVGSLRGGRLPLWEYPEHAFLAAGGAGDGRSVGSAAIYCVVLAVRLVDDLLDDEGPGPAAPGAARAANLALAFQAAAGEVIEAAELPAERRARCHGRLARVALMTARGQALDVGPAENEDDYWRIVDAKTVPILCASLAIGAEIAGAAPAVVEELAGLGQALGRAVQVHDDMHDALLAESLSDWRRPRHNLALLYALTAPHEQRERFSELVPRVDQGEALGEARRILARCGALSYCIYHVIELDASLRRRIETLSVPRRGALAALLDRHVAPIEQLFERAGVERPRALLRP